MEQWTEIEFEKIAVNTKLSDRTLAACRDVLVNGLLGKDAAERHKMFPAQISRALGVLRDKREEVITPSEKELYDLKKELVSRATQELMGKNVAVSDPIPGATYTGPVILAQHGFIVQKVGRLAVIHEERKLGGLVNGKGDIEIEYPAYAQAKANVKTLAPAVQAGEKNGIGR